MQMNNARSLPGPGILHLLVYKTRTGQLQLSKEFLMIVGELLGSELWSYWVACRFSSQIYIVLCILGWITDKMQLFRTLPLKWWQKIVKHDMKRNLVSSSYYFILGAECAAYIILPRLQHSLYFLPLNVFTGNQVCFVFKQFSTICPAPGPTTLIISLQLKKISTKRQN